MEEVREPKLRPVNLLHYRGFVFLTLGRVLCIAGNAMAPIAIAFLTLDISQSSSAALGTVMASRGFSVITFLLIGGLVSDRFPRRLVMVGSSATAAISQALAATLAINGHVQVWQLVFLQIPNGASASFLFPAMNGTLPQTVPLQLRRQANAVSRTGVNIAMIGGAALSGVAVAALGPGGALAINSGMYVIAGVAFARVRVRAAVRQDGAATSMLRDVLDGWKEFRRRTWLWVTVVQFSLVNAAVAVGFETLGPLVAKLDLGGARSWGIIVAAQGAGLVMGATIAVLWKPAQPLRAGWGAVFAIVPCFVALALHSFLAVIILTAALAGIGLEVFGLNWDMTMQHEIPADQLSRMYSYDAFGSNAAIPLGQIALAPGQAILGVQGIIWLSAILVAIAAVTGLWGASTLRRKPAGTPLALDRQES